MEVRSKVYTYRTAVKWTEQKKGVITCDSKPQIQVATPPEFKGHEGIWSPEDLYVAAANICLMTTFLAFAERAGLAFTAFQSEAEGRLERSADRGLRPAGHAQRREAVADGEEDRRQERREHA